MKASFISTILLFGLCVYPTEEVDVKIKRQTTTYMFGSSFYESIDIFDSIGNTIEDRQQFCTKLNGICGINRDCSSCRCTRSDIFVSYSLGCSNEFYFKGMLLGFNWKLVLQLVFKIDGIIKINYSSCYKNKYVTTRTNK